MASEAERIKKSIRRPTEAEGDVIHEEIDWDDRVIVIPILLMLLFAIPALYGIIREVSESGFSSIAAGISAFLVLWISFFYFVVNNTKKQDCPFIAFYPNGMYLYALTQSDLNGESTMKVHFIRYSDITEIAKYFQFYITLRSGEKIDLSYGLSSSRKVIDCIFELPGLKIRKL